MAPPPWEASHPRAAPITETTVAIAARGPSVYSHASICDLHARWPSGARLPPMCGVRTLSASAWGAFMAQVLPWLMRPASTLPWAVEDIRESSTAHPMRGSLSGHGAEILAPYLEQVLFQPRGRAMTLKITYFNQLVTCTRTGWWGTLGRAARAGGDENSRQVSGCCQGGQRWISSPSKRESNVARRHPERAATPCAPPTLYGVFRLQTPCSVMQQFPLLHPPYLGGTGSRPSDSCLRGDGRVFQPFEPCWDSIKVWQEAAERR